MQFLCRFYLRNKNISGFYLGFNRIAQSEHGAICLQSGPTIDRDESFNGIPLIIPQLISPLQRRPIKQNILVASGWNVWLGNISTFSLVQEGILKFIDEMISLYEFGHNDALKSSASPVTTIKFIGFDWWQLIELIEDLTPRWQSSLLTGVWTNIWVYLCLESLRAHNMFNLGTAFISDKFYWRFLLANVCSLAARIMSDIYSVNRLVTGPGPGRTLRHSNLAVTQI